MATKRANKTMMNKRRDQVMGTVKSVHSTVLELAEDLIEETVATGTKYQRVAASAIKKSEPIIEKQVDMIFDTLDITVSQIKDNNKRLLRLLAVTKKVNKATNQIGKIVKNVSEKVEEGIETAGKTISTTIKQGERRADKAVQTAKAEASKATKTVRARATKATKTVKANATKARTTVKATTKTTAPKRRAGRPRKNVSK